MCGIVGIASNKPINSRSWLANGVRSLIHRGPDSEGIWWSSTQNIGLAHRRLAIIDLSESAAQPMHDYNKGLSIVFNGEIYNFKDLRNELKNLGHNFRTNSDTEVLLCAYAQWGNKCVDKISGMFAFAIFDSIRDLLFIARDISGEKPLFYYYNNGTLRFASELKALLEDHELPRVLDRVSADEYLHSGYISGNKCILNGFNKLPPAHTITFNLKNGKLLLEQYWSPPPLLKNNNFSVDYLVNELDSILEKSVKRQLIADVPVGILLSGGIDSSLVTAMASRSTTKVHTFSVGFPGYGNLDETPHAKIVADFFDTEHTELVPEPTDPDLLFLLAKQFDEPIADSSMIPTFLLSKLVHEHCKVALGGDGGDELFGGYGHYSRLKFLSDNLKYIPCRIRHFISEFAGFILPVGFKGRNWIQGFDGDFINSLPVVSSFFDKKLRINLMSNFNNWPLNAEQNILSKVSICPNIVDRATRYDFQNYLVEDILVKVDRASMLNSLEIRAPFLDKSVINFAFNHVPPELKATSSHKKIILKKLCTTVLPKKFDLQRKQGFSIPLAHWLKAGKLRHLFFDVLNSSDCIFDKKLISTLLSGQDKGKSNSHRLFSLVMFELWRKEYNIRIE